MTVKASSNEPHFKIWSKGVGHNFSQRCSNNFTNSLFFRNNHKLKTSRPFSDSQNKKVPNRRKALTIFFRTRIKLAPEPHFIGDDPEAISKPKIENFKPNKEI